MKNLRHLYPLLVSSLALASTSAAAIEQGDWLVRGRIININPQEDSSDITTPAGVGVTGSSDIVKVDDAFTLDIDITYMFQKHWGAELLLDLSSKHNIAPKGALEAALGTSNDIIESRVLPPSLILQYHFLPDGKFRPYAGAGFNATFFFDKKVTDTLTNAGVTDVSLDDSFGYTLQIGADYEISPDWFANVDVKYLNIKTTADLKTPTGLFGKVDVDINPVVVGVGIGRRF
jgi:outer membrane protein